MEDDRWILVTAHGVHIGARLQRSTLSTSLGSPNATEYSLDVSSKHPADLVVRGRGQTEWLQPISQLAHHQRPPHYAKSRFPPARLPPQRIALMLYQSREQWQRKKKQFGVPRKVCKEVDMGDAWQTFNDSLPEGHYKSNPVQTLAAIEAFAPSLFTYAEALKGVAPQSEMNQELARAITTLSSL